MSSNEFRVLKYFPSLFRKKAPAGPTANCSFCTTSCWPDTLEQFRNDLTESSSSCWRCRILLAGFELRYPAIVRDYDSPLYIEFSKTIISWESEVKNWTLSITDHNLVPKLHEELVFYIENGNYKYLC
jgi:hypothetical protein